MKITIPRFFVGSACAAALASACLAASDTRTKATNTTTSTPAHAAAPANPPSTPAQHRQHITNTVNSTVSRPITVTSGYRGNSTAHQRGAIDIGSKELTPRGGATDQQSAR